MMAGRKVSRQSHVEVEETNEHQPIDDKTIASPMETQSKDFCFNGQKVTSTKGC